MLPEPSLPVFFSLNRIYDQKICIILVTCVGYNHVFAQDFTERQPPWDQQKAKAKERQNPSVNDEVQGEAPEEASPGSWGPGQRPQRVRQRWQYSSVEFTDQSGSDFEPSSSHDMI